MTMWGWLVCVAAAAVLSVADGAGAGAARLVCYVEGARVGGFAECTHLVYTGDARGDKLETLLKDYRKNNPRLKIILRVTEVDKDLRKLLKSKHVQGLEIHEAHKTLNKTKVMETVEEARAALTSSGGGPLFLALPAHPELLAKYYDLRTLVKAADLLMLQTHALGLVKKMTYHPSRLSGMWDMMNTDSVVDLVVGLGVPASKVVISLPATARQFTLANVTLSTPGSPTVDDEPKEIGQAELCRQLQKGGWTLERDQDLSAPYAFKDKTWIAFEDASSVDVKGKYARVRGLAGLALHKAELDSETACASSLKVSLAKVLNQQSRAPRAAVLRSLEHEILSAPSHARALDALQVSPYRITQVVDSDGVIHSIREDTRTEFSCSRQGYFVHPRSCGRFYRCVKFDQLSPEYTVFEFDCPAGLAFDSRYEVCVWPGSLPDSQACPGSSEIAPVPKTRFICPEHEGYYADPENCRWFFACLDHGKSPLTAYEFRCPFGLGFDAEHLKCDWPWVVPACGNIARYEAEAYGFSSAALTGAVGYKGQTADAINVAAHQSLVSGASSDNLVGIQTGFLSHGDALDSNYIASQELNNAYSKDISGGSYANGNLGLVQTTKYNNEPKYSTGSIILDEYRLPSKGHSAKIVGHGQVATHSDNGYKGQSDYTKGYGYSGQTTQYQNAYEDNSGAYVHDPTGDYAEPYKHIGSPDTPYVHSDSAYKHTNDYYDVGSYSGSSQSDFTGKYAEDSAGQYNHDNSGAYVENSSHREGYNADNSGSYNSDYSGSYVDDNSGKYQAGVYRVDGHIGDGGKASNGYESYSTANAGNYLSDAKAYTGASHTLTAGAVNVGLVGKTTLVDVDYNNQGNYQAGLNAFSQQTLHPAHVSYVSQPAVSISHIGTDGNNLDGYSYVTTPTSSGIPTTATPFAVTTAIPTVTYKTKFVPDPPKTSIKQILGYSQPAVTTVQPALIAVKEYASKIEDGGYNQGYNYQFESKDYSNYNGASSSSAKSGSSGYDYSKPSVKFEDGAIYTAPAVTVSTYNPQGFGHSQQTIHKVESVGFQYSTPTPVAEEPFKKLVAYTTGPSVSTYVQPTEATYNPHSFSHQTIHKVEAGNAYSSNSGSDYKHEGQVFFQQPETVVQYTTAQPAVVSTYQPQVFSQNTLHKVDTSKINSYSQGSSSGYDYSKPSIDFEDGILKTVHHSTPAPVVVSSPYRPQAYSHQIIQTQKFVPVSTTAVPKEYTYQAPVSVYQNPILEYTQKAAPSRSHAYSHSTIHKQENNKYTPSIDVGSKGYEYKSDVTYEQPKSFVQYTTQTPAIQPAVSTYQPHAFSQQTIHKVDANQVNAYSQESGYAYSKPAVKFQEVRNEYEYSTNAPAVVSTYKPQSYSSQTVHRVQSQKYVPVSSTALPQVDLSYQQVTSYENPILKYTKKVTPVTYVAPTPTVYTQTYQPIVHQHEVSHTVSQPQYQGIVKQSYENVQLNNEGYIYNQPEIQRNVETNAKTYSDATVVSHQFYHQSNEKSKYDNSKDVVFVTTSPSTLAYEDHYAEYEAPKIVETYKAPEYIPPKENHKSYSTVSSTSAPIIQQSSVFHQAPKIIETYKAPEYIPPKENYQQSYSVVSSTSAPVVHQTSVFHQTPKIVETYKAPEYIPPKEEYKQSYTVVSSTPAPIVHQSSVFHQTNNDYIYKPVEFSQQYETVQKSVPVQQVSFSTSHVSEPKKVESVHFSSFPTDTTKYSQATYEAPEIQLGYSAEEYLPPVVSSVTPIVSSTYKPRTYSTASTTREYLPPVDNSYLPPSSTPRAIYKATTPSYKFVESTTAYKASEYLPPVESDSRTVNFESFGFDNIGVKSSPKIKYNPYQDFSVPKDIPVVVSEPKRKQNIVVQNAKSNLLGFGTVGPDAGLVSPITYTTAAPAYVSTTYRPTFKSTTYTPIYTESTPQYKAPEYLPPVEQSEYANVGVKYTSVPVHRKNIVAEARAKAQQLSFSTVGPDAGLVSTTYTTAAPIVVSTDTYSQSPKIITSSYAPVEQGLFEVTPSSVPIRRTKPKVAVVTKLNDFNPLLVRKLGAVCSCQSPVLVLKGKRPNVQRDYDDFSNDYDDSNRGDVSDNQWAQKISNVRTSVVTPAPIVTSTFNPIIVPEDSYYQDYQEPSHTEVVVTPKRQEVYVSSTPAVATQRVYTVRPRVKAVTAAPTYKTVLLNQEVAPAFDINESDGVVSGIESQAFDRYGPGGWRSRDETLQGSVDCKRAGLFRHPKQCNKFYACRWDCTKQRFTLHVFNCPVQLSFDASIGACNWPSQGPACQGDTLLTNAL